MISIIDLFHTGKYYIESGSIVSGRTKRAIHTYKNRKEDYLYCRLYINGKRRGPNK